MREGRVKEDEETKDYISRLEPNDIAVLLHMIEADDFDMV